MKKIKLLGIGACTLALAIALASCGSESNSSLTTRGDRETLAIEAVSAFNVTEGLNKKSLMAESTVNLEEIEGLVQKANVLKANAIQIQKEESDREGFIEKDTISYGDYKYVMYISNKSVHVDLDDEDDEHEEETESEYEGILISGEKEYTFKAKEEIEIEDDEYESEFTLKVKLDDSNEVKIVQEIENEDDEYEESFKCSLNNKTIYKVSQEHEDDETSIKIQTEEASYKLKYYTKDSIEYLKFKDSNRDITLKVNKDDKGNISYTVVNYKEEK